MSAAVEITFPPRARRLPLSEALVQLRQLAQRPERALPPERIAALGALSDAMLARRQELGAQLPGVGLAFLVAFLRPEHLHEALARELPQVEALERFVRVAERKSLRVLPAGTVCHWIAGNVPLLGMFSWAISALLGNLNVVRLSTRQDDFLSPLLGLLAETSPAGRQMAEESLVVTFDREHQEAQRLLSEAADVRIAWGGAEAVEAIRSLPADWHTSDIAMGPRMSLAVVDPAQLSDAVINRLAIDAVYFDQLACSSPQQVFVRGQADSPEVRNFVQRFTQAFARQALANPRHGLDFAETYRIHLDRSRLLLAGQALEHDRQTQWTVALVDAPQPQVSCANRFIQVIPFTRLATVYSAIPSNVQTVITALGSAEFAEFTEAASRLGVCRFPQPGEGNHFEVPWDGIPLVSRLTRWVLRTDP